MDFGDFGIILVMMKSNLRYVAIFGNVIYILFIVRNGIDERGQAIGTVQVVALIGLIFLLILNIYLLFKKW